MDNKEEIAAKMMGNFMKILSAIFDEHNGEITLNVNTIEKAEMRFYIKGDKDGDKITFNKIDGESEFYKQHFPPKN